MATTREIQLRIRSVKGTEQITRAMKLVATAKLQKIRGITEANKPYFKMVYDTVQDIMRIAAKENGTAMPGFDVVPEGVDAPVAYLLITSDRGMAGGYNINICRMLERSIEEKEKALILTMGKRGRDDFSRRGYTMGSHFVCEGEVPEYRTMERMAEELLSLYTEGKVSRVCIAYTSFHNTLSQEPVILPLLPLTAEESEKPAEAGVSPLMEYEPSLEAVMQRIIPQYLAGILYGAIIEARTSEQGARMTAMDSATENAEEIVDNLTLQYNRARQSRITQELTEIVNGAAALH